MAANEERIRLAGGGEVVIRPIRPDDREGLLEGFERLGERSRYLRFMSPKPTLSTGELAYLTDVDHVDHEAIAAIDAETGDGLGVARYIRYPDRPELAEAAVAVVDASQRRGIGRLLLDRLADRATANGVTHFRATLLMTNHAVRRLFSRLGAIEVVRQGDGAMEVDVELPVEDGSLHEALRSAARRESSLPER
jgi:GNAT superfamily N-acetyltransferase